MRKLFLGVGVLLILAGVASPLALARSDFPVQSGSGRQFTASLFPAQGTAKALAIIVTGGSLADREGYLFEDGRRRNRMLADWAEGFAAQGITAITFDKTPDCTGSNHSTIDANLADIHAVIEAAVARMPHGVPMFLVGHSAGANMIQMLVARGGIDPAGVVLIGGGMSEGQPMGYLRGAASRVSAIRRILAEDPELARPHPELRGLVRRLVCPREPRGTAAVTLSQVRERIAELEDAPRYFQELRAAMATGEPLPSTDWNGIPAAFSRRFIELSQGSAEAIRKRGIPALAAKGTMDTAFDGIEDYPALVRALGADSLEFPGLNHFLLMPGATRVEVAVTESLARWMLSRL